MCIGTVSLIQFHEDGSMEIAPLIMFHITRVLYTMIQLYVIVRVHLSMSSRLTGLRARAQLDPVAS